MNRKMISAFLRTIIAFIATGICTSDSQGADIVYEYAFLSQSWFSQQFTQIFPSDISAGMILKNVQITGNLIHSYDAEIKANDLTFYVDPLPLNSLGRLQIGGSSNLGATSYLMYTNGDSDEPNTLFSGDFSNDLWNTFGEIYMNTPNLAFYIGNGNAVNSQFGIWGATIKLTYGVPVPEPESIILGGISAILLGMVKARKSKNSE